MSSLDNLSNHAPVAHAAATTCASSALTIASTRRGAARAAAPTGGVR